MNAFFTRFLLLSKRLWKKKAFVALFLLIPIFSAGAFLYDSHTDTSLKILVFDEAQTDFSKQFTKELTKMTGSLHFLNTSSKETLLSEVTAGNVECGYLLTTDFSLEHFLSKTGIRNCVALKKAPNSILSGMANEVFFSTLFQIYTKELLTQYSEQHTTERSAAQISALRKECAKTFEEVLENGETFSFTFSGGETPTQTNTNNFAPFFPIRGLFSILILLSALFGSLLWVKDRQCGISLGKLFPLLEAFLPAFYTSLLCLACTFLLNMSSGFLFECTATLSYCVLCTLFATLLARFFKNTSSFFAAIFLFALLPLVASPVFLDITTYVPALYLLNRLCTSSYYLDLFLARPNAIFIGICAMFILFLANFLLSKNLLQHSMAHRHMEKS